MTIDYAGTLTHQLHLSHHDIADMTGLNPKTVWNYVHGRREPTGDRLEALAGAWGALSPLFTPSVIPLRRVARDHKIDRRQLLRRALARPDKVRLVAARHGGRTFYAVKAAHLPHILSPLPGELWSIAGEREDTYDPFRLDGHVLLDRVATVEGVTMRSIHARMESLRLPYTDAAHGAVSPNTALTLAVAMGLERTVRALIVQDRERAANRLKDAESAATARIVEAIGSLEKATRAMKEVVQS